MTKHYATPLNPPSRGETRFPFFIREELFFNENGSKTSPLEGGQRGVAITGDREGWPTRIEQGVTKTVKLKVKEVGGFVQLKKQ